MFGGHNIIAENGIILEESKKFQRDGVAITADIDVDKLHHERATMPGTFTECARRNHKPFRFINFEGHIRKLPEEILRPVNPHPFVPDSRDPEDRCEEIFGIQSCALAQRLEQLPSKNVYIGVSGGLDSTLALLVAAKAYDLLGWDRKHIHGITMPGFGTTDGTRNNAVKLMEALGISWEEIPIGELALNTFRALKHEPFKCIEIPNTEKYSLNDFINDLKDLPNDAEDLVFENVQARLRTLILMSRGFVLGTGDLSEIALGWSTYNGDQMSMYNVNCSIPKTLVRFLVDYIAKTEHMKDDYEAYNTLMDIVGTVISPELLPTKDGQIAQSSEKKIGPYELHDFFLYHFIRNGFAPKKILYLAKQAFDGKDANEYTEEEIRKWLMVFLKRFFRNQFKRDAVPNGPKVGSVSLDPRGDWRMPSDAQAAMWIKELE